MKLKQLREEKGLSQYELAPQLKLKQATYANYEIEKTQPTIETLCRIADFYGVSLDYLCNHTTKNKIDLGYIDEKTITITRLTQQLTDKNKDQAFYYISGLLAGQ